MKKTTFITSLFIGLFIGTVSCQSGKAKSSDKEIKESGVDTTVRVAGDLSTEDKRIERKGPFIENDTTVLYECTYQYEGKTFRQKAYIDTNRENKGRLSSFLMFGDEFDKETFDGYMNRYRSNCAQPLKRISMPNLPEDWLPIESYRGKYYFYDMSMYPRKLTDSLFIVKYMDGPYPFALSSYKQIAPAHHQFTMDAISSLSDGAKTNDTLNIYIIDTKRQIAILETNGSKDLCIAADNASQLDYISWICDELPDNSSIEFDKIDYDALLKPFKKHATNE